MDDWEDFHDFSSRLVRPLRLTAPEHTQQFRSSFPWSRRYMWEPSRLRPSKPPSVTHTLATVCPNKVVTRMSDPSWMASSSLMISGLK